MNKFARAVAAREAASTAPTSAGDDNTTKITVAVTRHTHTELGKVLADLGLANRSRFKLGPVGVKLYEIFLDDPELQKEVVKRMK